MDQKQPHILWKDEFSVKVKEIDDQHKNFIAILNKMYEEAITPSSKGHLGGIIDELIKYAVLHFATEEKYFNKFHYPDSEEHIKAHNEIKTKVLKYKEKYAAGEDIAFEILDFIEDWLVYHLSYYDQKYSKFFNDHGLH